MKNILKLLGYYKVSKISMDFLQEDFTILYFEVKNAKNKVKLNNILLYDLERDSYKFIDDIIGTTLTITDSLLVDSFLSDASEISLVAFEEIGWENEDIVIDEIITCIEIFFCKDTNIIEMLPNLIYEIKKELKIVQ